MHKDNHIKVCCLETLNKALGDYMYCKCTLHWHKIVELDGSSYWEGHYK